VTLTNRLSLFFLTTLAAVLAGFSITLYYLASAHLHHQASQRLETTLNTLAAAVDVGPEGLEWEPTARHLDLGAAGPGEQVVWQVCGDKGQIIDASERPGARAALGAAAASLASAPGSATRLDWSGQRWQFSSRFLEPTPTQSGQARPPLMEKDEGPKYAALTITVGVSLEPVYAVLGRLLAVLVGLSLAVWLVALFVGRAVCRRVLRPVTIMAATAREMNANDLTQRMPGSASGDELADLGRAFNHLLDRLQEAFERQKRFTGDASHQLRTPLAAILGQIEVALRRERPVEEYGRVLTTVQHKAEHLKQIIDSLLFLARADSEGRPGELERLNLCPWLRQHFQTWSEHERFGDMALECPEGNYNGEVQPAVLGELVNILIDNACKYSSPGTLITIKVYQDQHAVCLQLQDQGRGISAEELPQVFAPFFRSAEARQQGVPGIGLGLSIAARLARALGGNLEATSRVGKGSCFTLRLPLAAQNRSPDNDVGKDDSCIRADRAAARADAAAATDRTLPGG
jgi:signal transduction histidine kinase